MLNLQSQPHRRFNTLTREWVLVSPHRTQRPWQGQVEKVHPARLPSYDPSCYLCPGNNRAGERNNPPYIGTFVFDNDFAALLPDTPEASYNHDGLLQADAQAGVCRVVCFSPRHDLTLADMSVEAIRQVVDTWSAQWIELSHSEQIRYVQIFENRGEMMGCSNPHPHGQIWAIGSLPNEITKEDESQAEYFVTKRRSLLEDYLAIEVSGRERIVCENEHFVCLVPFWAVWPFETMLVSRRHVTSLEELEEAERTALATILQDITGRYNRLFDVPLPYSMGFHQHPKLKNYDHWHLHAHFYPPLLRSATIRKFMVGFEMLAMPQRDITPEVAAERLRECR